MIALSALVILVLVAFWPFIAALGRGLFGLPLNGSLREEQAQAVPSAQSPISAASTEPPKPLVGIYRQVYPATKEHNWIQLAFGNDGYVTVTSQEADRVKPTPIERTRKRYVRHGNSVTIRDERLNDWMTLTVTPDGRELSDNVAVGYVITFARL